MKIYPTEGNWGRRVWAKRFHTQGGWGVCRSAFDSIDLGGLLPQGTNTGFSLRTTSRLPTPCEHGVLGLLTSPGDTTSRVDVKGCGSCATARRFPRSPQGSAAISFRSQKHSLLWGKHPGLLQSVATSHLCGCTRAAVGVRMRTSGQPRPPLLVTLDSGCCRSDLHVRQRTHWMTREPSLVSYAGRGGRPCFGPHRMVPRNLGH